MNQLPLVVLGSINIDHVLRVHQFPQPGETCLSEDYQTHFGGKGANQAVAAARSGCNCGFIACVGNDDWGQQALKQFASDGIDTQSISIQEGNATGLAMIQVSDAGENTICVAPQANGCVSSAYVKRYQSTIENAEIVLMQLETPLAGVLQAAKIAKQANTRVMLNPAPAQRLDDELLSLVDIITPNETEAQQLTGIKVSDDDSANKAAQWLHAKGITTVIITLGARGAWVSENGEGYLSAGFKVKAIDTTAAGDTFNGAFASEILRASSLDNALRYAHGAAALCVGGKGAQPSIPHREQVLKFIERS